MKLGISHSLRMFENNVLRGIFGHRGEGISDGWRNIMKSVII
jgi:hypothetical protein